MVTSEIAVIDAIEPELRSDVSYLNTSNWTRGDFRQVIQFLVNTQVNTILNRIESLIVSMNLEKKHTR